MNRRSLRALLSESSIVAPGAYDAVSAKIIESLDFPAIYLTGYGASASRLGLPDYGFITQTEMVAQVSGISKVVNLRMLKLVPFSWKIKRTNDVVICRVSK